MDHQTGDLVVSQTCFKKYSGSKANIKAEILKKSRSLFFKKHIFGGKHM